MGPAKPDATEWAGPYSSDATEWTMVPAAVQWLSLRKEIVKDVKPCGLSPYVTQPAC